MSYAGYSGGCGCCSISQSFPFHPASFDEPASRPQIVLTQKDSLGNTYHTYCDGVSTIGTRHVQTDTHGRVVFDSDWSKPKVTRAPALGDVIGVRF